MLLWNSPTIQPGHILDVSTFWKTSSQEKQWDLDDSDLLLQIFYRSFIFYVLYLLFDSITTTQYMYIYV
jgi:hypothetical protein